MEWIAIIGLAIVVIVGLAMLWRSTPKKSAAASEPAHDREREVMVDITPPGGGPP
jgi:hypothetical protein